MKVKRAPASCKSNLKFKVLETVWGGCQKAEERRKEAVIEDAKENPLSTQDCARVKNVSSAVDEVAKKCNKILEELNNNNGGGGGSRRRRAAPADCAEFITRVNALNANLSSSTTAQIAAAADALTAEANELATASFDNSTCNVTELQAANTDLTATQTQIATVVTETEAAARALRTERATNATSDWNKAITGNATYLDRPDLDNWRKVIPVMKEVNAKIKLLLPDSGNGVACDTAQLKIYECLDFFGNNTMTVVATTGVTTLGAIRDALAAVTKPAEGCAFTTTNIDDIVTKAESAVTIQLDGVKAAERSRSSPRTYTAIRDLKVTMETLTTIIDKSKALNVNAGSSRRRRKRAIDTCEAYSAALVEYVNQLSSSTMDSLESSISDLASKASALDLSTIQASDCNTVDMTTTIANAETAHAEITAILVEVVARASEDRAIRVHNRTQIWAAEPTLERMQIPVLDMVVNSLKRAVDRLTVLGATSSGSRKKRNIGDSCTTSQFRTDLLTDKVAAENLTGLISIQADIDTVANEVCVASSLIKCVYILLCPP